MESTSKCIDTFARMYDQELRGYAVAKFGEAGEDYLNQVYEKLLNYDKTIATYESGMLKFAVIRMLGQQHVDYVRSKESKHKSELPINLAEETEEETIYSEALEGVELNIIEQEIVNQLKLKNAAQIAQELDVDYYYIYRTIQKIKSKCQQKALEMLSSL